MYIVRIHSQTACKNKLQEEFLEFANLIEYNYVLNDYLDGFMNTVEALIENINNKHNRCKALPSKWEENRYTSTLHGKCFRLYMPMVTIDLIKCKKQKLVLKSDKF
jgi:hypothetical protein